VILLTSAVYMGFDLGAPDECDNTIVICNEPRSHRILNVPFPLSVTVAFPSLKATVVGRQNLSMSMFPSIICDMLLNCRPQLIAQFSISRQAGTACLLHDPNYTVSLDEHHNLNQDTVVRGTDEDSIND
jgi:hypothetical protein